MDTSKVTEYEQMINKATVVGTLEQQMIRGHELVRVIRRNELHGSADQIVLQVPSPFGHNYALSLELGSDVAGIELINPTSCGIRMSISGQLLWQQRIDTRFSMEDEPGRRTNDLAFHVQAIRLATEQDQPGCDVQLNGVVRSTSRVMRHPYRPGILLAATTLSVPVEQQRQSTRSRILTFEQVPVVIPLHHPDAPNLLRPGNRVAIAGMLERIVIDLRGPDVEHAIAGLDSAWAAQRQTISDQEAFRQAERRYQRDRRKLAQATRSRVVVGYAELIEGSPASPREAQALRRASVRAKRDADSQAQHIPPSV